MKKICRTGYKDKDIEKNYQALARRDLLLIWAYYVDNVDILLKGIFNVYCNCLMGMLNSGEHGR